MPKPQTKINPAAAVEALVRDFTARLQELVRRAVAQQLNEAIADELHRRSAATPTAGRTLRAQRMCPVPGCQLPAAGPRYRWRCRDHKEVSKEQIARLGASAGVVVQRLPPGPGPDRPRRPGPPMDCRFPGCTVRSKGPRYNYFCGEHYRELTTVEQKRYAEQWKLAHAKKAEPGATQTAPTPTAVPVVIRRAGPTKPAEPPRMEPPAATIDPPAEVPTIDPPAEASIIGPPSEASAEPLPPDAT